MRPKLAAILFLVVVVCFSVALYFKNKGGVTPVTNGSTNEVAATEPRKTPYTVISSTPVKPVGSTITPKKRSAAIQAEVDHLRELSWQDDPDSLSKILADLTHPEKEVREAAIEATKEFGSSNAVPALKAAAQTAEDTREKIALLEAVEFLELPQLSFDDPAVDVSPEKAETALRRAEQRHLQQEKEYEARKKNRPAGTRKPGNWSTTNSP